MSEQQTGALTDPGWVEVWRERPGDYYADSVSVHPERKAVRISSSGFVRTVPLKEQSPADLRLKVGEPTPLATPQPETPKRPPSGWPIGLCRDVWNYVQDRGMTIGEADDLVSILAPVLALSPPPDVERLFLVIDQPDHDWSHTATVVGIFRAERDAWVAAGKRGRTGRVYPVTVDAQVKYGDINALFSPSTPGEGQP